CESRTPPGLNEKKPQVEILEVFLFLGRVGIWGECHSHNKKYSHYPKIKHHQALIKKQTKNQLRIN
ncbi:hypothetical protein WDH53_10880, partial [Pasteurella multocida subsp. multocida]|uniref:hypothetical protein n=1 Tax=Pasteurella multocida TaxID=747 RepID=UPI003C79C22E